VPRWYSAMRVTMFLVMTATFVVSPLFADALAARKSLIQDAEQALEMQPVSVMDKTKTPPSGDKHDYLSQAPYWWPDPTTPDGLPYIRRDGEVNPEYRSDATDRTNLGRMMDAVSTLGLAYGETQDERYAEHAAKLLRAWFLDPATRMNPNLDYAQGVPGISEGRGFGIIDTSGLTGVIRACGWLGRSDAFTDADNEAMREWFAAYLNWLQASENGKQEAATLNNHATHYDVQVVAYALFTGQRELARRIVEDAKTRRIATQIEPDGTMPLELERTRAFSYSTLNLRGFFDLADLARDLDVDLWNFETPDGRGLRKALDYLAPYVDESKTWPHPQIGDGITTEMRLSLAVLLRRAGLAYGDPRYEELIEAVSGPAWERNRVHLLWPAPPR